MDGEDRLANMQSWNIEHDELMEQAKRVSESHQEAMVKASLNTLT